MSATNGNGAAIRLGPTEFKLMELMIEHRMTYGWDMAKRGGVKIKGLYVLLGRLRKKELVSTKYEAPEGKGNVRRLYKPTAHGRDVYRLYKQLRSLS